MLNLSIAVLKMILLAALMIQGAAISIDSPQSGDTLRGSVPILGSMDAPNFSSADLAFGFDSGTGSGSDSAAAWFALQSFAQPKLDSPLYTWDTTTVTDGTYKLRLRVNFQDGSLQDIVIAGLKITNEIPQPTSTPPELSAPAAAPTITTLAAPTVESSLTLPTAAPSNPAALSVPQVYSTFRFGALLAGAAFVLIALFLRYRRDS